MPHPCRIVLNQIPDIDHVIFCSFFIHRSHVSLPFYFLDSTFLVEIIYNNETEAILEVHLGREKNLAISDLKRKRDNESRQR